VNESHGRYEPSNKTIIIRDEEKAKSNTTM